jgi:carbon-monoxide dehydrogenase medium subunit
MMKNFSYFSPKSLRELYDVFTKDPEGSVLMAGGTDVMLQMRSKAIAPRCLFDLRGLGLSYIKDTGTGLAIGATTTLHQIESSPIVKKKCPVLSRTCSEMASYSIRHLGTIGGNLCNAAPSADTAPALIVLGSQVRIKGPDGERLIPVPDLFVGPGETGLTKGEVLTEIQIPDLPAHSEAVYLKFKRYEGMDLALVGVAARITLDDPGTTCQEVRIGLGAVAPTPVRASGAERVLEGNKFVEDLIHEAARRAKEAAQPIGDVRASADYRASLVEILTRDALLQIKDSLS